MSALAGEVLQPSARAAGVKERRQRTRPRFAEQKRAPIAPIARIRTSIDAGLAGLVYGALASPVATPANQFVPRDAGGKSARQQGAPGPNSAAANGAPAAGGALWRALAGRGPDVNSHQAPVGPAAASLAPVAESGAATNFALPGVVDGPVAESGAAANFALPGVVDGPQMIQMAANGDASLGVVAMRSRTHLGVDSAAKGEARNPIWRPQARSDATQTPVAGSAVAASSENQTPPEKRSTSGHDGSPSASPSDPSAARGAAAIGPSASPDVGALAANLVAAGRRSNRLRPTGRAPRRGSERTDVEGGSARPRRRDRRPNRPSGQRTPDRPRSHRSRRRVGEDAIGRRQAFDRDGGRDAEHAEIHRERA